ncbi:triokinase/FMN cyclase-like [Acanthaster planci]|uniref:Triokinase/FMN cyclase n=1 Tax=Acanthaster planci TaxID=133434 RepID=A0A8B7ZQ38_ACAPL|nr:triokinase/FMN cyclase-like [Acanthaster planci]
MADPTTKKLINSVDACVDQSLEGLVASQPGLRLLQGHRVVIREDIEEVKKMGKVTILSGGGSGHEPAHAGFVGQGMLSGAVAGSVFTSPPPNSILAAIRAVGKNNPAGTLLIVKNYTGDRLNFGLAAERATAEGLRVGMVVIGDDCALTSNDKTAGRRGLCGTILIHKIAGAMAEEGQSLEEIVKTVQSAVQSTGTIGVCLYPCSLPGAGHSFHLGHQDFELGLGIHGEAGVQRMQLCSADEVVKTMLDHMTSPTNQSRLPLETGDNIALVINNLGGTSYLELGIVARAALKYLATKGVSVKRAFCGTFMTSLEMAGVSVTIMHLDLDGILTKCLDQDTTAPAWPRVSLSGSSGLELNQAPPLPVDSDTTVTPAEGTEPEVSEAEFGALKAALHAACDSLAASEDSLNELDRGSGDGDCGTTIKNGVQGIVSWLSELSQPISPSSIALKLSSIAETHMGGSSGALYSLFFTAAATVLQSNTTPSGWVNALKCGMDTVSKYGGAEVGDRTMLDSLHAAFTVLQGAKGDTIDQGTIKQAAEASRAAAEATAAMDAKAGRASYVSKDRLTRPDPGAMAVAIWMTAVASALQPK